jgi:hypothetical protein
MSRYREKEGSGMGPLLHGQREGQSIQAHRLLAMTKALGTKREGQCPRPLILLPSQVLGHVSGFPPHTQAKHSDQKLLEGHMCW